MTRRHRESVCGPKVPVKALIRLDFLTVTNINMLLDDRGVALCHTNNQSCFATSFSLLKALQSKQHAEGHCYVQNGDTDSNLTTYRNAA